MTTESTVRSNSQTTPRERIDGHVDAGALVRGLALSVALASLVLALFATPAQAAVVYISQSSGSNDALPTDGTAGPLTIPIPSGVSAGRALIASIAARPRSMTVTVPSGWILMTSTDQPAGGVSTAPGGMTLLTYYKIATASEPASYTWTFANPVLGQGGSAVGGILAFSGVDTSASPIDVWSARLTPNGTTHSTNSITPTVTNTMIVSSISFLSSSTFGNPTGIAGITERLDVAAPPPNAAIGTTLQMSTAPWATTTATGASQAVAASDADTGVGHLMALRPSNVDLAMVMVRSGPLIPGGSASYTLTVTNSGSTPESGPITVVDTLPTGLTFASSSGSGWSCGVSGQVITCTRAGALTAGASAPDLILNVNVSPGASGTLTNTATVSGTDGDANLANNTAVDSYTIPIQSYAYYAMDEASWGAVIDSSGNGRNGTVMGAATPTGFPPPSPPGSAIPGNTGTCGAGRIPITSGAGVDTGIDINSLGNAGSITLWYSSNTVWDDNNDRMLLDASNDLGNGNADKHFYLVKGDKGEIRFGLEDDTDDNERVDSSQNSFPANQWHHIAITWDWNTSNQMHLYLDGVLVDSEPINDNIGDYATLYLGTTHSGIGGTDTDFTTNTANGYIDEVRVYASALTAAQVAADMNATHSCIAVDHYEISYPNGATAVTCESLNVRITAHDAAHAAVAVPASTALTLNTTTATGVWLSPTVTGTGTWTPSGLNNGQASYTWPGGESVLDVRLRHNTPLASIGMNLGGTYSEAVTEDPAAVFVDAAFRVTDAAGAASVSIGTQIAGKDSNVGFGAQTRFLQAIRTDAGTGSCVGVFPSQTVTVQLASECNNPGTCVPAPGSQVSVRNSVPTMVPIAQNNNGAVGSYTPVSLAFDAQSKAPLVLNYPDAGQITLHARYALPAPPTTNMIGSSNALVVRPFGFAMRGADATTMIVHDTVATNPPFAAAGDNFTMTVAAYGWAAGEDADVDGIPDSSADITNNGLTPNFQWDTAMSVTANLPGAALGSLTLEHVDTTRDSTVRQAEWVNGAVTFSTWRYTEVGNALFAATASNYISASISLSGNSGLDGTGAAGGYVGRFRPKHFALDTAVGFQPTLANRATSLPCSAGDTYSYMGEAMRMTFRLLAQNTQNGTTQNYTGAYAKLDPTLTTVFNFGARSGTTDLSARAAATYFGVTPAWANGQLNIPVADPLHVAIARLAAGPDGLYAGTQFGIAPTDSDGVAMASYDLDVDNNATNDHTAVAGTTEVRFGRLLLQNAFGSELLPLSMSMVAQYYLDATSGFVTNGGDGCTAVSTAELDLSNNIADPPLGTPTITTNSGPPATTTVSVVNNPFAGGVGGLTFSAPGNGGDGYADISANLTSMDWLRFDWDGGGANDDDPSARATFGIYKGSPRQIYLRERH